MAISDGETQVVWSAANSVSVASGGNATSDAFTISDTAIALTGQAKADNDGTPASGDTVDFYLLSTLGDPDGASTDEYTTVGHATFLFQLDTNSEDPAISEALSLPLPLKGGKIYAVNNSGGRAITVSFTLREKTSA